MFKPCELNIVGQKIGGGASYPPISSAFNPSTIPGFVAGFVPSVSLATGNMWQDAAKTIAASANNDPVRVVRDPWSGIEYTAPSDAARGLLKISGGKSWIETDGVDDFYKYSNIILNNFDWLMSIRQTGDNAIQGFAGSSPQLRIGMTINTMSAFDGSNLPSSSSLSVPQGTDMVIGYSRSVNTVTFGQNATNFGTGTMVAPSTFNQMMAFASGSNLFGGRWYGDVCYSSILSQENRDKVVSYLQSLYS